MKPSTSPVPVPPATVSATEVPSPETSVVVPRMPVGVPDPVDDPQTAALRVCLTELAAWRARHASVFHRLAPGQTVKVTVEKHKVVPAMAVLANILTDTPGVSATVTATALGHGIARVQAAQALETLLQDLLSAAQDTTRIVTAAPWKATRIAYRQAAVVAEKGSLAWTQLQPLRAVFARTRRVESAPARAATMDVRARNASVRAQRAAERAAARQDFARRTTRGGVGGGKNG